MINDNLQSQLRLIYENMIAKANSNQIKGNFVTVKEMADITTGKEDANFSTVNGKYKFFTCSNVPLQCDEYAFESSSILIAGNGDFNVKHYTGEFNAYQRTYVITPNSGYNIDYIYYSLLLQLELLQKQSAGSQTKFLTMKILNGIEIADISLDEQIKISKSLTLIDCQIKRNNDLVQKLQVLSHAIFNQFFADETELVSLVDFPYIEIIKPGILPFEGTKHYIATGEVEGEKLNFSAPLIEFGTRENRANMQPIPNSVWFAKMKRSLKHIYVTSQDDHLKDNYVFSTGFCGIKCDDIAFEYMINYLNLPYFEKEKDILSHGATMEGVNNKDLKSFKIHLPSRESLIQFHSKTKDIHCRIAKINEMTHHLTLLKNKLLPLLINGQLQ